MKDYGLLLKTTRESREMTQEQAADAVGVSVDSWYAYEANLRLPPMETVPRICEVLNAGYLAWYFQEAHSAGAGVLPAARARRLPSAVLTLLNRVLTFSEQSRARELMEIAEDGVIDETERALYEAIISELDGIVEAALAVKFPITDEKKERPEGATSKRSGKGLASKPNQQRYYSTGFACNSSPNFAGTGGVLL